MWRSLGGLAVLCTGAMGSVCAGADAPVAADDYLAVVAPEAPATPEAWDVETIQRNGRKVADWMLAHPPRANHRDWTYGAFYAGLTAFGLTDPSMPYLDAVRAEGRKFGWKLEGRPYHADSHCIGQAWLELAFHDNDPAAVLPTRRTFDYILENPSHVPVVQKSFRNLRQNYDRWCWCDALFMAPPVWARLAAYTGADRYRDFMIREFRATAAKLYDRDAHLFHRDARYLDKTTKNGKKVFWSRGCGWVFGALPLILRELPDDLRSRAYFETMFKEMAAALKNCQRLDGAWSPSLLDPGDPDLPEMSGTAFFCYGVMWGINRGLLDETEYLPVARRAWKAMCRNVSKEGKFGWVQPIGDRPDRDFGPDSTEVYAVGAYLLAASEIRAFVVARQHPEAKTVVVSPVPRFRRATVEVPLQDLNLVTAGLVVWDVRDAASLPYQLWDGDGDGAVDTLLFAAAFHAGVSRTFRIFRDPALKCPDRTPIGLAPGGGTAEGDRASAGLGTGCSFSHQGRPVAAGTCVERTCRAEGPVRTVFEEIYSPVDCGAGVTVRERRTVARDRGQPFVRHTSVFEIKGAERLLGGPCLDGGEAGFLVDLAQGRLASSESRRKQRRGQVLRGIFASGQISVQNLGTNRLQVVQTLENGVPATWYVGSRELTQEVEDPLAVWNGEMANAQFGVRHPLDVSVK
ncbi:MAG: glycoside hydrolase family 88 protein [Kiritimatiellia bacterium]